MNPKHIRLALVVAALLAANAQADPIEGGCDVSLLPVGQLVALTGNALAMDPCAGSRPIACGDELRAGEALATGPGSTAALMLGDTLVTLDPDSTARVDAGADGVPVVTLERGGASRVDADGATTRLGSAGVSGPAVGETCEVGPTITPVAHLVPTPPVGAPPPGAPALPEPPVGPPRSPCDNPGSGCVRGAGPGGSEPPPTTDPFPGGGGPFPGPTNLP